MLSTLYLFLICVFPLHFCFFYASLYKYFTSFTYLHYFYVCLSKQFINLLKPTGYMMHHQFNIQQLYALPTLYLCVLYLSEKKQRLVPLTA